jgi:hypothetical protein
MEVLMKILTLYLFVILNLISCITNRVYFVERPDLYAGNPKKITQDFYLAGIGQVKEIDLKEVCGSKKPEWVQTQFSGKDVILGLITMGIYTPRTVDIYCK